MKTDIDENILANESVDPMSSGVSGASAKEQNTMKRTKAIKVNRKKMGLCALVLVGWGSLVATAPWGTAATLYITGKVGDVVVTPNGDFFFNVEPKQKFCNDAPLGSTLGGYDWIVVTENPTPDGTASGNLIPYATPGGKKDMLTLLTIAKLSGRSITVRGVPNYTKGEWGCHLAGLQF